MLKRVVIVDDHPVFRTGLKALIANEGAMKVVGEAAGVSEALQVIKATAPDIVVIDLYLSEGSGIQLIKAIRAHNSKTKLLVASMHQDMVYAERVLRLGANGYINKEQAADKIIEAIHTVFAGKVYLSQQVSDRIVQRQLSCTTDYHVQPVELLSNRELEVFYRIGRGLSTKKIAQQLHVSTKTVDSHREHIKRKLGIENGNALITSAVAWVLNEGNDDLKPN